jgi:hypothetical protein
MKKLMIICISTLVVFLFIFTLSYKQTSVDVNIKTITLVTADNFEEYDLLSTRYKELSTEVENIVKTASVFANPPALPALSIPRPIIDFLKYDVEKYIIVELLDSIKLFNGKDYIKIVLVLEPSYTNDIIIFSDEFYEQIVIGTVKSGISLSKLLNYFK